MTARRLFVAVLVLYTAIHFVRGVRETGAADGFYAYLYARSLAFDGDLDFANDYALCGDPFRQGIDRGTGHLDDPAYSGPAVFWTPLVLVGRALSVDSSMPLAVRAGCVGPIPRLALGSAMPLGALVIALAFDAARRFARAKIALVVAILFAVASSLLQYATIFVSSSHVYEAFSAALVLWLAVRAREGAGLGRWALVGLAMSICTLQRLSDAVFVLVPLALLVSMPRDRAFTAKAAALVVAGTLLGVGLTASLYTHLYGSPFVLPQGRHFLHLWHSHPWLLLFSPHGGLFFTTPIAYLGVLGLGWALVRSRFRSFAVAASTVFVLCLWISSAPLDWHAKATFGARRLVVLTPLFIVFGSIALDAAWVRLRRHRERLLATLLVLLLGIPVVGGVLGTTTGEVPLEGGSQAEMVGGGVRAFFGVLDSKLGDVAILPAEAFYAVRFRLPMRTFRAATTDHHYRRSYRDLSWEPNTLDFKDGVVREASAGASIDPKGVRVASDAHFVFTAGWPFATNAALRIEANDPGSLSITLDGCSLGEHPFVAGSSEIALVIPAGCFDSGLLELRIQTSRAVIVENLLLDDANVYQPPYGR